METEDTKVVVQDNQELVPIVLTGLLLTHSVIQMTMVVLIMVMVMQPQLLYIIMTTGPLEEVVVVLVAFGQVILVGLD